MALTFAENFLMAPIKSVYISLYVAYLFFHSFSSLMGLANNDTHVDWLASFLAAGIPLFYFVFIYLKRPFELRTLLLVITSLTTAAFMIVLGYKVFEAPDSTYPLIGSAIALLGWIVYNSWYARLKRREVSVKDLGVLNEKVLVDQHGAAVNPLEESHKYRLFILHRGSWCPVCVAQVKSTAQAYSKITDLDVQLNFISPQSPGMEMRIVEKFNFPGNFFQDPNLKLTDTLGLRHASGLPFGFQLLGYKTDTILPTVILTDNSGVIIHLHQTDDYRRRPEPEFFERIIRSHSDSIK